MQRVLLPLFLSLFLFTSACDTTDAEPEPELIAPVIVSFFPLTPDIIVGETTYVVCIATDEDNSDSELTYQIIISNGFAQPGFNNQSALVGFNESGSPITVRCDVTDPDGNKTTSALEIRS